MKDKDVKLYIEYTNGMIIISADYPNGISVNVFTIWVNHITSVNYWGSKITFYTEYKSIVFDYSTAYEGSDYHLGLAGRTAIGEVVTFGMMDYRDLEYKGRKLPNIKEGVRYEIELYKDLFRKEELKKYLS